MSGPVLVTADAATEAKWQAWRAHAAASDRRSATTMNWLFAIAGSAVLGWLFLKVL